MVTVAEKPKSRKNQGVMRVVIVVVVDDDDDDDDDDVVFTLRAVPNEVKKRHDSRHLSMTQYHDS